MAEVLVLLARGFEEIEAVTVIDVLRRAGVHVTAMAVEEREVSGSRGVVVVADAILAEVKDDSFDLVYLPGGLESMERLAADPRIGDLLRRHLEGGGKVAAICASTFALHAHGLLADEARITSHPSVSEELKAYRYLEDRGGGRRTHHHLARSGHGHGAGARSGRDPGRIGRAGGAGKYHVDARGCSMTRRCTTHKKTGSGLAHNRRKRGTGVWVCLLVVLLLAGSSSIAGQTRDRAEVSPAGATNAEPTVPSTVASVPSSPPIQRLIVLGFDGADPRLLRQYMASGELPGFQALKERGSFLDLETTSPAQSPVSWSSIITGLNPGKTGIYGFVELEDDTRAIRYTLTRWADRPLPETGDRTFMTLGVGLILGLLIWASVRFVGIRGKAAVVAGLLGGGVLAAGTGVFLFSMVPVALPTIEPVRDGEPFYKTLADQGIAAVALQAPMDAPPAAAPGLRVLCGLGVPDITGADASWAVYTSRIMPVEQTPTGGRVVLLESLQGVNQVDVLGPVNPFVQRELRQLEAKEVQGYEAYEQQKARVEELRQRLRTRIPMTIRWKPGDRKVELAWPGVDPVTLEVGAWSPFIPVTFRSSSLVASHGLLRFYLDRADAELRLYQEPIGWDPRHPSPQVPLSTPADYVQTLARDAHAGLFETAGWACATNAFRDRMIGEEAFVEDVMAGMRKREALLRYELEQKDWRCLFAVFTGVDRLQHMLWRHIDETHPAHRPEEAAAGQKRFLEIYKAMDRLVSMILRFYVDDRTALVVISDHGFAPFRWSVNLNTWLREEGYLTTREGVETPASFTQPFATVDWSRTRAFAYGLGQIRINVKRNEHDTRGIVPPAERASLAAEIATRLKTLQHRGRPVVPRVDLRDEVYHGPHRDRAPDLVPGLTRGYRVSGATVYGGVPSRIIEADEDLWSGDHCSVSPDQIPGILLTSRPLASDRARGMDMAPSVLSWLGAVVPEDLDGRALSLAPGSGVEKQ